MRLLFYKYSTLSILFIIFFAACRNDKGQPEYKKYPYEIGKIVFTKCATTGCHNNKSKDAAAMIICFM